MAPHILPQTARALLRTTVATALRAPPFRPLSQTAPVLQDAIAPARKPIGAFRGGLFGFLFGSSLAGYAMYYYVLDEYRVSNELLTGDIHTLHAAVQRTEGYIQALEERVAASQGKK